MFYILRIHLHLRKSLSAISFWYLPFGIFEAINESKLICILDYFVLKGFTLSAMA